MLSPASDGNERASTVYLAASYPTNLILPPAAAPVAKEPFCKAEKKSFDLTWVKGLSDSVQYNHTMFVDFA
jgi:hypothetical protein